MTDNMEAKQVIEGLAKEYYLQTFIGLGGIPRWEKESHFIRRKYLNKAQSFFKAHPELVLIDKTRPEYVTYDPDIKGEVKRYAIIPIISEEA